MYSYVGICRNITAEQAEQRTVRGGSLSESMCFRYAAPGHKRKKYPQLIYWKNGKVYKVDHVRDVYLNDSPSGNGKMKLYGVEINGHFTDLVEDGDKWYVYEK